MIVIFVIHNFLSAVCRCHCCTQRVNNSFFMRSENPVIDNVKPKKKIPVEMEKPMEDLNYVIRI